MDNTNIYTCSGQGVVNVVSLSDFSLSYISGFSWPSTLCIDNNDDDLLYIVDKYTMYIAIYQKSTKTKIKVISNLNTYNSRLNYITVDDDNIYVTSEDNNLAIIDKKLYTLKKRIGAAGYGKLTNTKNYVYIENNNRCFNKLTQTIEIMSVPLLQSSLVFQYDGNKYIYAAYYGGDGGWYFLILDENNKFYNLFNSYSNSLIYIGNNKIITNNGTTLIIYNFDPLKIKLIRSLTGGNSYLGADGKYSLTDQSLGGWPIDSEWDKYIVKSNLNGKITPGDNNIWHWNGNICSFVKDTTNVKLYANTNRIVRGDYLNLNNPINYLSYYQSSSASASHVGFRPVLEYIEFGSKQTNLWY
jgi:hypothetical protein